MSESPNFPTSFVGAIERRPTVALWLGIYLADFAALELLLIRMLGLVLDEHRDAPMAWQIFGYIRSISDRFELLERCAVASTTLSEETRTKIVAFIREMRTINARRNEYVHGVYETTTTGSEVILTTWGTSTTRKGHSETVTSESLQKDVQALRALTAAIMNQLFSGELEERGPLGPLLDIPLKGKP